MHTKLTEEQLHRLNATQAAGEPVPADIRELVVANYEFDGSESEEIIAEAARNLGTSIYDIFRETLVRHGMDPNIVFDDESKDRILMDVPYKERWLHTSEMKAKLARADAWMRANPPGPDVPIGAIKSFGLVGPKYEVGNPLRQLDDGDWIVKITLIESGETTEYRLSNIKDDPEAP